MAALLLLMPYALGNAGLLLEVMMGNSFAINGMFLTPEPEPVKASSLELTSLQAHVLAQFAHVLAIGSIARERNDADLQQLVELVTAARYRDCVAQGVVEGARAMLAAPTT